MSQRAAWLIFGLVFSAAASLAQDAGVVLVSYNAENQVGIFDAATLQELAVVPVGRGPHEITVSPDGRLAYVANSGSGPGSEPGRSISVIDIKARKQQAEFQLEGCDSPHDVRASRDGGTLWIACAPAKAVLELNAKTGALLERWDLGAEGGWFVEVSDDDRKLYVPHLEAKRVTAVDRKSGKVAVVHEGGAQYGIALSPDGHELWVTDSDSRSATVLDTGTDKVKDRLSFDNAELGRLVFARDGRQVFIAGARRLLVIDARTRRLTSSIELPLSAKVLTAATSSHVFLSSPDESKLMAVDVAAKSVRTIPTGKTPDGVAWAPPAR